LHQAELQTVREENCCLNTELEEAKSRQEEQGAQVQRLKDKLAHMKDTLGQAQQKVVSEGL
jgi:predicted  nucleic acid-binding Zn-ribbon protein